MAANTQQQQLLYETVHNLNARVAVLERYITTLSERLGVANAYIDKLIDELQTLKTIQQRAYVESSAK